MVDCPAVARPRCQGSAAAPCAAVFFVSPAAVPRDVPFEVPLAPAPGAAVLAAGRLAWIPQKSAPPPTTTMAATIPSHETFRLRPRIGRFGSLPRAVPCRCWERNSRTASGLLPEGSYLGSVTVVAVLSPGLARARPPHLARATRYRSDRRDHARANRAVPLRRRAAPRPDAGVARGSAASRR